MATIVAKISQSLIKIRKQNHLTQSEMAKELGISRFMISSYENEIRSPSVDILMQISKKYGVSVDDLLKGL